MSAERGWIADPPPPPPRDYIPGEEHKWDIMMNAGQFSDKYKTRPSARAEEQRKTQTRPDQISSRSPKGGEDNEDTTAD